MLLKKTMLTGLAIGALSLPTFAAALSLDVYNATNEDSTVKVAQTSLCSSIGGNITPAHGESHTSKFKVKILCAMSKKCDAVMYASKNCTGNPVSHLSMNTDTLVSTVVSIDDPRYTVITSGNRVDIAYAG